MCCEFLSYIAGGGALDWDFLEKTLKEFDLEPADVIDDRETPDINNFIYRAYDIHADNLKTEIEEFLDSVDQEALEVYKSVVEDYYPNIYTNYLDSGYDDKYDFWDAKDLEEIFDDEYYYKEFVEFLVDEGVIDVNRDKLPEEYEDENDYEIVSDFLKIKYEISNI